MSKKLIAIGVVILLLILGFVFRSTIITQYQVLFEKNSISVESQVPGKSLAWENKKTLQDIVQQLQIFEQGARDIKTHNTEKVNSIHIIYTPEEQSGFANMTPNQEVISAGSYDITNQKLTIKVSVNPLLAPNNDTTTVFNQKVIEFLVLLSLTSSTRSTNAGNYTTIEDRTNYFYDILKEHFTSGGYPIKII